MAADAARLGDEIQAVTALGADILHWDIMDGHFVPNLTFGVQVVKALRPVTTHEFDVHLMVTHPENWIDGFADAGADTISFHVEAIPDPLSLVTRIKQHSVKAGLAFNPETPLTMLDEEHFAVIDRILVMTVKPGFGGQAFIPQDEKIRQAAAIQKKYPHLDIMIDGGINLETAKPCVTAGATSLVSGSALFNNKDRGAFISALKGIRS